MPYLQGLKSKHWCFTINNPTSDDAIDISLVDYVVLGNEICPDTGTPHIQGYIIFKIRKRLITIKQFMSRARLAIKYKDSTPLQASDYCKKDGNFLEYGILPGNTSHNVWEQAKQDAIEGNFDNIPANMLIRYYHNFKRLQQDNPQSYDDLDKLDNVWVLAPTRYGKSYYARYKYPDFYDKPPNKWFVGYKGQTTILLDDFGPNQCKYLGWYIKRWSDIYPFPIETKGGGMDIRPIRIVLTSQYTIDQCFPPNEDQLLNDAIHERFRVKYLKHWKTKQLPIKQIIYVKDQKLFSSRWNTDVLTPRQFNHSAF